MRTWIDKHSPTELNHFICYQEEVIRIRNWIEQFQNNRTPNKKVLLLLGKSGVGKTSLSKIIYNEYRYRCMELNVANMRSKNNISDILEKSLSYRNVFDMMDDEDHKIGFLIDDVESFLGIGDKGGFGDFLELLKQNMKYEEHLETLDKKKKNSKKKVKENKFLKIISPIICTSLDSNDKKLTELKKYSEIIYLQDPIYDHIHTIISQICMKESIIPMENAIEYIYSFLNHDIRQYILFLQNYKTTYFDKSEGNILSLDRCRKIAESCEKDDDKQHILQETKQILFEKDITMSNCERIFGRECLLMPLMVYHNIHQTVKKSPLKWKDKVGIYKNILECYTIHDITQTSMMVDLEWDDLYDIACFFSMKLPNYHLQLLQTNQEEVKVEYTNLLNKISQMLVNKKLLQSSKKSLKKIHFDTDNILYIIKVFSSFLGDIKKSTDDVYRHDDSIKPIFSCVDEEDVQNVEEEDNDMRRVLKENKKKSDKLEMDNLLVDMMNQYSIDLEDLENIMKIDKLNHSSEVKKKKFTTRMKKHIEYNLVDD